MRPAVTPAGRSEELAYVRVPMRVRIISVSRWVGSALASPSGAVVNAGDHTAAGVGDIVGGVLANGLVTTIPHRAAPHAAPLEALKSPHSRRRAMAPSTSTSTSPGWP